MGSKRNLFLTLGGFVLLALLLWIAQEYLNPYYQRILTLSAIYAIFAVTFNLIFGYTGQFSLGHAGFAAVGAYVTALLTMSPAQKTANFFLQPIVPFLRDIELPFLPALLIGGFITVLVSLIVGWPALRLRGDYLAIATLGFSEIIRVLLVNLQPLTNGALGLKGIPSNTNLYWAWGFLLWSGDESCA
jgi:branched-chain amino acid transport system permease protein